VKKQIPRLILAGVIIALAGGMISADPIPTPWWVSFLGTITINGQPAPVGTIIDAYDPQLVNCGRDTAIFAGNFGFMPVYRDDGNTGGVDEGALPGDPITFEILGLPATVDSGYIFWDFDGDTSTVHLSVTATIDLVITDPPTTQTASPLDTVRFLIGVHNTGNIRDFYGITVNSARGWEILYPAENMYNEPDSVTYVWFDVAMPEFYPGDRVDTLSYTVYSQLDPTVTASGSVELDVIVLDVGNDPDGTLPGAFALHQNYPNPFNPTTTIGFALETKSTVRLDVFNVLGQSVAEYDLGTLSAGEHTWEFDGSDLSSGIYYYRLATDEGSDARKMVLMK